LKFKIDENLPVEVAVQLVEAGHDAVTVHDQGVGGTPDAKLASLCQTEERALVTLDLGFGDIRSYPPSEFPGLVVFRLDHQDKPHVLTLCRRFIATLEHENLSGSLWIVEEDQIRIWRSDETT
jgi:predicted nuclease of predicted toxin-antitoxin system